MGFAMEDFVFTGKRDEIQRIFREAFRKTMQAERDGHFASEIVNNSTGNFFSELLW